MCDIIVTANGMHKLDTKRSLALQGRFLQSFKTRLPGMAAQAEKDW
jgi:hypothetical protein